MGTFAYVRVSTGKQDGQMQIDAIKKRVGDDVEIVQETESGSVRLEKLQGLILRLGEGDTLAVYALDRIGRKLKNVLEILESLHTRKVKIISVREGIDFSTAVGRMVAHIMSSVAEMEREMIIERTKNALKTKKNLGYLTNRPWKFGEDVRIKVKALREAGYTYRQIAEETGVSLGGIRYLLEAESRKEEPKRKTVSAA